MKDGIYNLIVSVLDLFLWDGRLMGEENLPSTPPAVFIANHHEALGPIAVACSIPLRLYSWIVADMVDPALAPAWLQWDFVERTLHLKPPLSAFVAKYFTRITVPFLRSLGTVPVYKHDYARMSETLDLSLEVIRQGHFLLVFPEDNMMPRDPATQMGPFQHTFARLGEMYFDQTRTCLPFYPVTVHPRGLVIVGQPVLYDPSNPPALERRRLKDLLEDTIHTTYLQVESTHAGEFPLLNPQHK